MFRNNQLYKKNQVAAVGARKESDAEEFAKKYDIPKAYGLYEEVAKDPNVGNAHRFFFPKLNNCKYQCIRGESRISRWGGEESTNPLDPPMCMVNPLWVKCKSIIFHSQYVT